MRSIFCLVVLVGFGVVSRVFAQGTNEANTVFGGDKSLSVEQLGFFVAPSYGLTQMDQSAVSIFHLRGGLNLKDKISLGAYFSTSLNEIQPVSETLPKVYMDYWSVGGFAEYTIWAKKMFHLTLPIFVGYGEIEMDNENGNAGLGETNFWQIEPSALLEVNLHEYIRFNMGTGYRIVGQLNYRNLDEADLTGLTGYVGLKFGRFR